MLLNKKNFHYCFSSLTRIINHYKIVCTNMKTLQSLAFVFLILGLSHSQNCGPWEFECENGNCIPEMWVCDGDNDCGDLSDEPEDCPPCPEGYWLCANGNCVRTTYICDGQNDCGDMSDEFDPETGSCPRCPDTHFQCSSGSCIEMEYVCDGYDTCGDNSDEPDDPEQCPACGEEQFRCANGMCVPYHYACNGQNNCGDNSDEPKDPEQCPPCREGDFRCASGMCIPGIWACDGENDCGDMSDEPSDPDLCPACSEGQFRCDNGKCIEDISVCDGQKDCSDWSDECEIACPCADDEFRCSRPPSEEPSAPGPCIPGEWVCDEDGIWDCPDGSDQKNCSASVSSHTLSKSRRGSAKHFLPSRKGKQQKHKKSPLLLKLKTKKKMGTAKKPQFNHFWNKKSQRKHTV